MLQEFRDFINRGNVIDLAVAVVLGAAFAPVVSTLVDRVLMPLIGMVVGEPNFDTLGVFACAGVGDPESTIVVGDRFCSGSVGAVVTTIVNFLLVGFALFLVAKAYNRLQDATTRQQAEEVAAEPEDTLLLRDIRDALVSGAAAGQPGGSAPAEGGDGPPSATSAP